MHELSHGNDAVFLRYPVIFTLEGAAVNKSSFISGSVLVLALATLTGCSDPTDANESNFTKAINEKFSNACVAYNPIGMSFSINRLNGSSYPVAVALVEPSPYRSKEQTDQINARSLASLEQAVKIGLLEETDGEVPKDFGTGNTPAKIFSLTKLGEKALMPEVPYRFCAAHYQVASIEEFTKPNQVGPVTVSQVSYTFALSDQADWAKDAEIQKELFGSNSPEEPRKGRAVLVQTNKGWRVDGGLH